MMATFIFANFFQTTLSASVTTGATSISVASGTGAPTIAAGQQWAIVVQSAATPSVREVMYVTAVSGAAFTVVRGQEGTTALAWSVADNVSGINTAGQAAAAFETATPLGGALSGTLPNPAIAANVNLPGAPTSTTAAIGTNDLQLATTAFVNPGVLFSTNGYFILPSGLIVQWGGGNITSTGGGNTPVLFNLSIPYPNANLFCVAGYGGSAPGGNVGAIAGAPASTTQVEVTIYTQTSASAVAITWLSFGH